MSKKKRKASKASKASKIVKYYYDHDALSKEGYKFFAGRAVPSKCSFNSLVQGGFKRGELVESGYYNFGVDPLYFPYLLIFPVEGQGDG